MRIGNLELESNLLLSPIAGYCDLAFRLTVRPLGGLGLACTDLLNPRGLLRGTRKSLQIATSDPADRPLCVQLYGDEPAEMAAAAQWCQEHGANVIDINMGCPVEKICKRRGGAALLRDTARATRLACAVVNAVSLPVTAKLRLGWDDGTIVASELAVALEDAGIAAVTVHGRTAMQRFRGKVHLDGIARVAQALRHIPVIGNGDVCTPEQARDMIRATGCAGVMIGRAALSDPWIFRDTHALLTTGRIPSSPTRQERVELMNRHFGHLVRLRGERVACTIFRQRVTWYARYLGASREFLERMRRLSSAEEYGKVVRHLAECSESATQSG